MFHGYVCWLCAGCCIFMLNLQVRTSNITLMCLVGNVMKMLGRIDIGMYLLDAGSVFSIECFKYGMIFDENGIWYLSILMTYFETTIMNI